MSKYTTEVRFICESLAGKSESTGASHVDEVLDGSWAQIFDNFPIFDEAYRGELCKKILKHYYTREIGFETYGLWKLKLNTRMEEIMPYYNKLYESTLLEYDPLHQIDYTRTVEDYNSKTGTKGTQSARSRTDTINRTDNGTLNRSTNGSSSDTKRDLYSDTPQGALNGVENETYLTTARKITDGGTTTGQVAEASSLAKTGTTSVNDNNTVNGTESENSNRAVTEHISGKRGGESYAKLLEEYRDSLINVDIKVINALSDLFMLLW